MIPSPQRHLSYPTQKQVFLFLSLSPRRSLAIHCPETRNWQKKLPYRFEKIEAVLREEDHFPRVISIDGVVWTFFVKYFDSEKVILPNGETRICDYTHEGLWNALLEYYLNREGTQVHHFQIKEVIISFFWDMSHTVWNMTIGTSSRTAQLNSIYYLYDNPIEKLTLCFNMAYWIDECDFLDFQDGRIKCKEFKLEVTKFEDFSDFHVISDNCNLVEHEADHLKFVERCREMKKYSIGSDYGCVFTDKAVSVDDIWMVTKQGFGDSARVRYTDKFPGLYVPIDEAKELFIYCKEIEFSPQFFRTQLFFVKVQEAGKSDPYHQLSLKRKLEHWNNRRHEMVHRCLTNLEVAIVKWWFGIDLASWTSKLIKEHEDFDKLITISKVLMWLRHYHLFVLSVLTQILIILYLLITSSNPLITIITFLLFSIPFNCFSFRPFKTLEKSVMIICPPY